MECIDNVSEAASAGLSQTCVGSRRFDLGHMNAAFLFTVSLVEGFRVESPLLLYDSALSGAQIPVYQPSFQQDDV